MKNEEHIESLITNDEAIKKIEANTLIAYKSIFELSNNLESYFQKNEELKNEMLRNKIDSTTKSKIENQIQVINSYIKENKLKLNLVFEDLYRFANEHNYFFCYSSFKTYKFYFNSFWWNFKRITGEDDKVAFFKHEYEHHFNLKKNKLKIDRNNQTNFIHRTRFNDSFSYIDFSNFLFDTNKLKISIQIDKILSFIENELAQLGYTVKVENKDIFFNLENSINNEPITEEPDLKSELLPDFNVQIRYYIMQQLNMISEIETLQCQNQSSRNKLLAIIMNINPSNAKHLMNDTYYPLSEKAIEKFKKFLLKEGVDLEQFKLKK